MKYFIPPLPQGEGWGEGGLKSAINYNKNRKPPHPNPLPMGEGITGKIAFSFSLSF